MLLILTSQFIKAIRRVKSGFRERVNDEDFKNKYSEGLKQLELLKRYYEIQYLIFLKYLMYISL